MAIIFERGENLLQNGILHFIFRLSQSLKSVKIVKVRIYADEKPGAKKRGR